MVVKPELYNIFHREEDYAQFTESGFVKLNNVLDQGDIQRLKALYDSSIKEDIQNTEK